MQYKTGRNRVATTTGIVISAALAGSWVTAVQAEEGSRRIEEIVVTAERRESTVSDTSISISAFDGTFLENFNIRNQEDLQNFIPATTIQPYDAAIRGVGRTARTLGGDPGVATYFNGAYSEDFGIASTEGGLFDIERVEVLRGPQGTLYGRNAVGGAINFVSKRPNSSEFEAEVKGTVGNYDTTELFYLLSGPIIEDKLAFRFTGTDRRREGYIENTTPGEKDVNDYGDENYALALEWTPTDELSFYVRGNERSYKRRFNGGSGTMPIIVSENGGLVRDTTTLVFGQRIIDRSQTSGWSRDFFDPTQPVRSFRNPATGALVEAQGIRPGIDFASGLTAAVPDGAGGQALDANGLPAYTWGNSTAGLLTGNYAFGHPQNRMHIADRDSLDKGDLRIDTNGPYDEFFDHQGVQFNATWAAENWELKYMGGYTDFFYDRDTDEDKTGNDRFGSKQFYVLQENENWQHELQLTVDSGNLSVTAGAFIYDSTINQRLDLYDPIDTQGRFQADANYSGLNGGITEFGGMLELLELFGALGAGVGAQTAPLLDMYAAQTAFESGALGLNPADGSATLLAPWYGDTGTGLRGGRHSGSSTPGTYFAWDNDIETRAYAAYTQAKYDFNEQWAVTLGVRYAKDEKLARERLIGQQENIGLTALAMFGLLDGAPGAATLDFIVNNPAGFAACGFGANLLCLYNGVTGAIDPAAVIASGALSAGDQGTNPGDEPIRYTGVPIAFNLYRPLKNDWDTVTWRANVDYQPNDETLLYLSATTGWRSGGYNLGFFSTATPEYDEENILAYELGYKGTLFDGRMQLNTSIYLYQYDDIHTIVSQAGGLFGTSTNVVNFPEASTIGWEGDLTYLLGDYATVGANWSYTKAEFDGRFDVIDTNNPDLPGSIFTAAERTFSGFKGASLPKIPEWKGTVWGSYTWPMGDRGRIDLFSALGYTDEYFFSAPFERELERTPSFVRWDARISWVSSQERWEVATFVNNITGDLGVRELEALGEADNFQRRATTNDPRVYGLTVAYRLVN